MLNDINSLRTQGVTGPRTLPTGTSPVAVDPFDSDEALDAFLRDWTQSDTSNLETLAQVASAPVQTPAPMPAPDDDATRGIEFLVVQNRSLFTKAAESIQNAPSRLLMTDENSSFQPTSSKPGIFNDASAWKLFEPGR